MSSVSAIAQGANWTDLRDRMFDVLDSNASGAVTKDEIRYSSLAETLMKHWSEMPKAGKKKKKKGKVTQKDWVQWFDAIKKNGMEDDEDAMQQFCAKLVFDADIDVSDLLPPTKEIAKEGETKTAVVAAKGEEGFTRQVFTMLGKAYLDAKTKIDSKIPSTAASKLSLIEKAIDSRYGSVADAIDNRIELVKTKARERIGSLADSTTKKVEDIAQQPLLKDLVAPVACAVVDGLLEAGDVIVDYALPESDNEETKDAPKAETPLVLPHAKNLACKLTHRLRKRAEGGIAVVEDRKKQLQRVQVDLIAYAKGFLGQQKMLLKRATEDPTKLSKEKLQNLQEFATAVMEPYRQKIKGKWNDSVEPVLLAVTDYGEYFMENVREYENSSKVEGEEAPAPSTDNDVNRFITRVARRFVEPSLIRTVAVFMVLGDEMRRIKVQSIEPNVLDVKTKVEKRVNDAVEGAQRVVEKVMTHVNGRYVSGLKRIDGELVKFEEFKERLTVHVKTEFDAISASVQSKIFAAIQSLPWSGKTPVTLKDFKDTVAEKVGEEYQKYEKYISPLIKKIHEAIVLAEEWATPWVDAVRGGEASSEDGL